MTEGGALPYKQVIHVLETALSNTAGISVKSEDNTIIIVKDGVPEVIVFSDEVTRKMVQRLAHKYNVNTEWFYHPDWIHKAPPGLQ